VDSSYYLYYINELSRDYKLCPADYFKERRNMAEEKQVNVEMKEIANLCKGADSYSRTVRYMEA